MLNLLIAYPQDSFLLANRLLGALAFGDVHLRADHAVRRAVRTSQQRSAREEPAHAAILVGHPMLDFVLVDAAVDARLRLLPSPSGRRQHGPWIPSRPRGS